MVSLLLQFLTIFTLVSTFMGLNVDNDVYFPQYHVREAKNWVNDPNGPMLFKGTYHLFYQYNPYHSHWGNISWAHSVSKDLVTWKNVDVALINNDEYDAYGVFSGSTTIINDGEYPVLMYTCVNLNKSQKQCLAIPKDVTDENLVEWVKVDENPLITEAPPNGDIKNFRDPSTGIKLDLSAELWFVTIGVRMNGLGHIVAYSTLDFRHFSYAGIVYGGVDSDITDTMVECPDLFVIRKTNNGAKLYVLKASVDSHEQYWIGTMVGTKFYRAESFESRLLDYGEFYASKSFDDYANNRQVLWGWVLEHSSYNLGLNWSGMQSIPRVLMFDDVRQCLVTPPLPELTRLRAIPAHVSMADTLLISSSSSSFEQVLMGSMMFDNQVIEIDSLFILAVRQGDAEEVFSTCYFGFRVMSSAKTRTPVVIHANLFGSRLTPKHINLVIFRQDSGGATYNSNIIAPYPDSMSDMSVLLVPCPQSIDDSFGDVTTLCYQFDLRIFVDRTVIEAFADKGSTVATGRVYLDHRNTCNDDSVHTSLFARREGNTCGVFLQKFDLYGMGSIDEINQCY